MGISECGSLVNCAVARSFDLTVRKAGDSLPRMRIIQVLFLSVILCGCANISTLGNKRVTQESAALIRNGMTREQVREILGKPDSVSFQKFGNPFLSAFIAPETWSYSALTLQSDGIRGSRTSKVLTVSFGADGCVADSSYFETGIDIPQPCLDFLDLQPVVIFVGGGK